MNEEKENASEEGVNVEKTDVFPNKKQILEKTVREYFDSGNDDLKKKRYNSALVLFFKCLVALVDVKKLDRKPRHSWRGRFLSIQKSSTYQTTAFKPWWCIDFLISTFIKRLAIRLHLIRIDLIYCERNLKRFTI